MVRHNPWTLAFEGWQLALESASVTGLRTVRLAAMDTKAMAEAQLMVAEKAQAFALLQVKAATGGLGRSPDIAARRTIAHYGKAVRGNRRRLRRP